MSFNSTHKSWVTLYLQIHFVVLCKPAWVPVMCGGCQVETKVGFFLLLSSDLMFSGVPPEKPSEIAKQTFQICVWPTRGAADSNRCITAMPTLSDMVSCSYHISHDYPLLHQSHSFSGVMWSQGAGFNSPGECCWKSPWNVSLKLKLWSVKRWAHKSFSG